VCPLHPIVHYASSKDINSKQSINCKLNFLNAVKGKVNLDVKASHALQKSMIFFTKMPKYMANASFYRLKFRTIDLLTN